MPTRTVAETVYKGNIRDWGKTKKSLAVIHVPRELADDLHAWRLECEERAREAAAKDKTNRRSSHLTTSSLQTKLEGFWTRTTFAREFFTNLLAISIAEVTLLGHSQNDRDIG